MTRIICLTDTPVGWLTQSSPADSFRPTNCLLLPRRWLWAKRSRPSRSQPAGSSSRHERGKLWGGVRSTRKNPFGYNRLGMTSPKLQTPADKTHFLVQHIIFAQSFQMRSFILAEMWGNKLSPKRCSVVAKSQESRCHQSQSEHNPWISIIQPLKMNTDGFLV